MSRCVTSRKCWSATRCDRVADQLHHFSRVAQKYKRLKLQHEVWKNLKRYSWMWSGSTETPLVRRVVALESFWTLIGSRSFVRNIASPGRRAPGLLSSTGAPPPAFRHTYGHFHADWMETRRGKKKNKNKQTPTPENLLVVIWCDATNPSTIKSQVPSTSGPHGPPLSTFSSTSASGKLPLLSVFILLL